MLSREETGRLLSMLEGTTQLMYGTGLRLMECVRLRVKDVDFARDQIFVREGKGGKDRVVMLPESLEASLRAHLERIRILHEPAGVAGVYLPHALSVKYPNAGRELCNGFFPVSGFPKTRVRFLLPIPENEVTLFVFTDIFDGVFRYLADILVTYLCYEEQTFWSQVADIIHDYQHEFPDWLRPMRNTISSYRSLRVSA